MIQVWIFTPGNTAILAATMRLPPGWRRSRLNRSSDSQNMAASVVLRLGILTNLE